jgi:hypothetical protein
MSKTKSHYNPRSKKENYKSRQKLIENGNRKEEKKKETIKKILKRKTKNEKRKENASKKVEKPMIDSSQHLIMNFTDYDDMGLRVPVKYNIFGTMKSESQKLIKNILEKNIEYLVYNIYKDLEHITLFKRNTSDPKILIERIMKFVHNKRYHFIKNIDEPHAKEQSFFSYKDKEYKEYYFVFNLSVLLERYRKYTVECEHQLINFIELHTHFYNNINLSKYKFKNPRYKFGIRAEFFNTCTKNYYMISNNCFVGVDSDRTTPCVYRFYYKAKTDFSEFSRIDIKNINSFHISNILKEKPKSVYLFTIPNKIRYYSPYKSNKKIKK